jgi:hypothetical protein
MHVYRLFVWLFVLFCFAYSCAETGEWSPPEKVCQPTDALLAQLRETSAGNAACLVVKWGKSEAEASSLLVRLRSDGGIVSYRDGSDTDLRLSLPSSSKDKIKTFSLFVFGKGADAFSIQPFCEGKMKGEYTCERKRDGECWFAVRFTPKASTSGLSSFVVPNSCEILAPDPPGSESHIETTPEPDAGVPDAVSPEKQTVEPLPEPEPTNERVAEPPVEKRPEQTPDAPASKTWVAQVKGKRDEQAQGMAIFLDGSMFITGTFSETAGFGGTTLSAQTQFGPKDATDLFVAKLDANGVWVWAQRAGGDGYETVTDTAISPGGDVYITGQFERRAEFGKLSLLSSGESDVYIVSISPGGLWTFTESGGGFEADIGDGVSFTPGGDFFVAGRFTKDAYFGPASLNTNQEGGGHIFVSKLSKSGNWTWTKSGKSSQEIGIAPGMQTDSAGNTYFTGYIQDDASFGGLSALNRGTVGARDAYVVQIDVTGNWKWVKTAGSKDYDVGKVLAIDGKGNLFVVGTFSDVADFGTTKLTAKGTTDIFVATMDIAGNWKSVEQISGPGRDDAYSIAWDANLGVVISGSFEQSVNIGGFEVKSAQGWGAFVAAFTPASKQWRVFGVARSQRQIPLHRLSISRTGALMAVGEFAGNVTFSTTGSSLNATDATDGFVWRIR